MTAHEGIMDLYHLHRQGRQTDTDAARNRESAPAPREIYNSKDQWDEMRKVTAEASRWKREHDSMKEVSVQLAYKAEQAKQAYHDLKGKHQNLQANHDAMLAKYRELQSSAKACSTDDRVHLQLATKAEKWKARCKLLAADQERKSLSQAQQDDLAHQLEDQIHDMQARESVLQADIKELKNRLGKREFQLEIAKKSEKSAEENLKNLRINKAESAENMKEVNKRLAEARAELESTKDQLSSAMEDSRALAALKSEIPAVKSKLKAGEKLKSELESAKSELDSTKDRLKSELDSAKSELDSTKDRLKSELETAKDKLKSELESAKDKLKSADKLKSELESAKAELNELQGLKAEIPAVKEKLKAADEASRTLKLVSTTSTQLRAELVAAHEKLRAATHASSAKAKQHATVVQTCATMLANAQDVLQACSELHARKDSPLGGALAETTAELAHFLSALSAPK